jgi:hypothetical protein
MTTLPVWIWSGLLPSFKSLEAIPMARVKKRSFTVVPLYNALRMNFLEVVATAKREVYDPAK